MNYAGFLQMVQRFLHQKPFKFFPLPRHLQGYNAPSIRGDLRAGLNVALLAFPQGMAYALIAGLPIEYGIYGSAVAAIAGGLFAGSRFITLGPTNATSVMLASSFAGIGIMEASARAEQMPLMLLMVGGMLVIGAFLRVANFIQYISRTVVTGYITAASLLIIIGQVPKVFGFSIEASASTFIEKVIAIVRHFPESQLEPIVLSAGSIGLFYGLQSLRWTKALPNVAVTLLVMSVVGSVMAATGPLGAFWNPESLLFLEAIDARQWPLGVPRVDFDSLGTLANGALAVALLCVLEGTSIGKSLAARSGERLNTDQEMYNIGMANLGCAFAGGMPASGSLTRSQLSWSSGGKTPMASLYNGLMVAAGAFLVGGLIDHIPTSVLASLVITIGFSLFNKRAVTVVTTTTKDDKVVFYATFLGGLLFPLNTAIYLGAGLSIILFLRKAATPEVVEYEFTDEGELAEKADPTKRAMPEVSIIHAEGDLFFGSAEMFQDQMRRVADDPNLTIVVCKMRNARHLDATTVMALEELVKYMNEKGRSLILSEVRPPVMQVLRESRLLDFLNGPNGEPFVFEDTPQNPTISTARALKRAQELLGGRDADVKIYVNPRRQQMEAD